MYADDGLGVRIAPGGRGKAIEKPVEKIAYVDLAWLHVGDHPVNPSGA
jgi:hypothetical protein